MTCQSVRPPQLRRARRPTLEELLERTKDYVNNGEYWSEGPRFRGQSLYPEFWVDFEILTGIKVPKNDQYSFFSCSC